MEIEFKNKEELKKRVMPALILRQKNINKLYNKDVSINYIWEYLIKNVWIKRNNLQLNEVVNDILNHDIKLG